MTTSKLPAASTVYTKGILFAREEQIVELKHYEGNGDIKHPSETNDYTSEIIKTQSKWDNLCSNSLTAWAYSTYTQVPESHIQIYHV